MREVLKNRYNIDVFNEDLDRESRPYHNMWVRVVTLALEEAVSIPDIRTTEKLYAEKREWKYQALNWWYKPEYELDRKIVFSRAMLDEEFWKDMLTRAIFFAYRI